MIYDYLIVGQGLSGSILAYQLLNRGKTIAIIDEKPTSSSSKVGAGLVNPFTGPKMVKSWRAEILFPFLKTFYKELEKATRSRFFTEKIIYRPFASIEKMNDWDGRSSQPNYQKFIIRICEKDMHSKFIDDPFGGAEVYGAVLNMPTFLKAMHAYMVDKCKILEDVFDEKLLTFSKDRIDYKGLQASKIILCTGYKVQKSIYFGWVPIAPVKGEILHLKSDKVFETIYNKLGFIIPQDNGLYKAGSTYDRHDLSEEPTEHGKNEISKKLDTLLKMNYKIVKHEAGIRPGTIPRRPLIGRHPRHDQMYIFNGMGTKGVSLAPFFGDQFVKCLEDGNYLDQEVDIKKYYSLYFNSHFPLEN